MGAVFAWARDVGQGLDELTPEQRKEILQMVVEEVIVDRNDNVDITLAIPIESEPTTEDSVSVQTLADVTTLEPSFDGLNSKRKTQVLVGGRFESSPVGEADPQMGGPPPSRRLVRPCSGGPKWLVGGTIFEMWLGAL